jgi:RecB family exonuclease
LKEKVVILGACVHNHGIDYDTGKTQVKVISEHELSPQLQLNAIPFQARYNQFG